MERRRDDCGAVVPVCKVTTENMFSDASFQPVGGVRMDTRAYTWRSHLTEGTRRKIRKSGRPDPARISIHVLELMSMVMMAYVVVAIREGRQGKRRVGVCHGG